MMNRVFGIGLVVLAIAIAVVPAFTDCQSQGRSLTTSTGAVIAMKCHWTGVAEMGVAIPLALVGGMIAATRRKTNLLSLGILGVALGGMAIAFPAGLIGVCQNPTMICHSTMSPALVTMGSVTIVGGLGTLWVSRKMKE